MQFEIGDYHQIRTVFPYEPVAQEIREWKVECTRGKSVDCGVLEPMENKDLKGGYNEYTRHWKSTP